MSDSNALRDWPPPELNEQVRAIREPIYDSFRVGQQYVQEMWIRVAEAKGALAYHRTDIDLDPVIDFLQFVQEQIFDQGLRVAGEAQQAVYAAWDERQPIVRQQRRSLVGLALVAHDPGVAHVA